jgi:DNA-binding GntR family transcriptional regulator
MRLEKAALGMPVLKLTKTELAAVDAMIETLVKKRNEGAVTRHGRVAEHYHACIEDHSVEG